MTLSKKLLLLLLLQLPLLFLSGCGPFYRNIVKMEPVNTGDYTVDSAMGSCVIEKAGIKITLNFEERQALEALTPYIYWNPYLSEQKYFFSVFKLTVENKRENKISIDTGKAVLLDGLGGQENTLTLDYFKTAYPTTTVVQQQRGLRGTEFGGVVVYTEDYYRYGAAEKSLFKNGEIYPAVKMEGYIVFDQIRQEAGSITVVIPAITLLNAKGEEIGKTDEIRFKFNHTVTVKEGK